MSIGGKSYSIPTEYKFSYMKECSLSGMFSADISGESIDELFDGWNRIARKDISKEYSVCEEGFFCNPMDSVLKS